MKKSKSKQHVYLQGRQVQQRVGNSANNKHSITNSINLRPDRRRHYYEDAS